MYHHSPNLVLGFHGCTKEVFNTVLYEHKELIFSRNLYDWLGNGIYFWENSLERAMDWAVSHYPNNEAAVIGCVLDMGYCLDLMDYSSKDVLIDAYSILKRETEYNNDFLPQNKNIGKNKDLLIRDLDCAVLERVHHFRKSKRLDEYDSVRGAFIEGKPIYPNAGFREKTHIQICIRNPNCIKGYFAPKKINEKYKIV